MLNTYGIFAAGYFFRPLGGIVMAHFGDLVGRKRLFSLSILLMSLPTLMIGILPTFETIGYAAPLLLLMMRIIQGIAIGGEIPAAWTFVSEHVPESRIGIANGLLTAGLSLGILLGALMSLLISVQFTEPDIHAWAWRIAFVAGGIFGLFALYLRSYLKETPVFKTMQARKQLSKELPVQQVVMHHRSAVVIGMLFTWFLTGCVVVIILAMPNLLIGTFGYERALTFKMQSAAILMQMLGCILAGTLADRFGCARVMMAGATTLAVTAGIFYQSLEHASHSTVFILYMLLGLCSGTVGMVSCSMVKMFPAPIRFSGISFSYNVSYAIVGGMTLPLIQILSQYSKIGAMYYIFALAIMAVCTAFVFKTKFETAQKYSVDT